MPRRQTLRRRRFGGRKRSQSELEKELKSLLTEKSTKKQHKNKFQRVLEDLEKRSWIESAFGESTEKKDKKARTKKQSKQVTATLEELRKQIREVKAELAKAKKEGKKGKEVKALEQQRSSLQQVYKWFAENPVTGGVGGTLAAAILAGTATYFGTRTRTGKSASKWYEGNIWNINEKYPSAGKMAKDKNEKQWYRVRPDGTKGSLIIPGKVYKPDWADDKDNQVKKKNIKKKIIK